MIEFENISKQYRLGLVSTRTLSHDFKRWYTINILGKDDPYLKIGEVNDRAHRGESEYVWALKDINFKVEQGDVLGIIGKNGAGKSTLLKILSKVTTPSTGTIKARGRIASLLEVGTGFHPEMTGRENIYMNGAIMGMTKAEISRKFDEIVDFSGVERYIDTPAKRYSSGMTVRLGFAIAAHLDPEILVVDEVLAVGDAEFQKKAIGKMQDVSKGEGRTVLFVSHNMASMQQLCNRGLLLENGISIFEGTIDDTINKYIKNLSKSRNGNVVIYDVLKSIHDIEKVQIVGISKNGIFNESGQIFMDERLVVSLFVKSMNLLDDIKASIIIQTETGVNITAVRSFEVLNEKFAIEGNFCIQTEFKDLHLMPGNYNITVAIANKDTTIRIRENCIGFSIIPSDIYKTGRIPKGNFLTYSSVKWELIKI